MRLKDHDLKQFNREYFASLSPEQLLNLAENTLNNLRDAGDQQNQTPQNSSRPSGSYAPWEQAQQSDTQRQNDDTDKDGDAEEKQSENDASVTESGAADIENKPDGQKNRGSSGIPVVFSRKVAKPRRLLLCDFAALREFHGKSCRTRTENLVGNSGCRDLNAQKNLQSPQRKYTKQTNVQVVEKNSEQMRRSSDAQARGRGYAMLASVIDTCRQRDVLSWEYIAQVIEKRRKNNPVPSLPTLVA